MRREKAKFSVYWWKSCVISLFEEKQSEEEWNKLSEQEANESSFIEGFRLPACLLVLLTIRVSRITLVSFYLSLYWQLSTMRESSIQNFSKSTQMPAHTWETLVPSPYNSIYVFEVDCFRASNKKCFVKRRRFPRQREKWASLFRLFSSMLIFLKKFVPSSLGVCWLITWLLKAIFYLTFLPCFERWLRGGLWNISSALVFVERKTSCCDSLEERAKHSNDCWKCVHLPRRRRQQIV